ncbi:MAG: ribonuclease III [Bdellovibrionota bacterium]
MLKEDLLKSLPDQPAKDALERLLASWKLEFGDLSRLALALTHSSYIHENPDVGASNERLEFLGDSVLGLAVSETLMSRGSAWTEGELSRLKSYFVSEVTLAEQARKVELGICMRMGKGERSSGGADREAGLADAVEAIIGALFLDQGFAAAAKLVRESILPELSLDTEAWNMLAASLLEKDAKSKLQEFFQQEGLGTPRYVCTNSEIASSVGPFDMALLLGDVELDRETATSKREATQLLARRLLAMAPPDLVRFVATQLKQKGFMTSGIPT